MDRDFKGVWIPKEIWLNKDLSMLEKVIYTEISSLDNENHCTAGNEYFAEFCGCSTSAVTKAIKHLQELELIEIINFDGRHRKISLVNFTRQTRKFYEADSENLRANNIDSNTGNKEVLSKDNTTNFLGSLQQKIESKSKGQNQYQKCLTLIKDFTDDKALQDYLMQFYKVCSENAREAGTPFYTNTFKGKLNKLKQLSEDTDEQIQIVLQTLNNGWNSFYAITKNKRKTGNVMRDIEQLEEYTMKRVNKSEGRNGNAEKF